jgi:hypothetical protein
MDTDQENIEHINSRFADNVDGYQCAGSSHLARGTVFVQVSKPPNSAYSGNTSVVPITGIE